ncbi:putative Zn-dependent peptidase [Thermosporothrix hazakensis]|jgi:predicted Zn-dependent peptidase|uniref:Peptidase M16 n=2 Tax=Thermosporothrix TaxID=768650 RepID=A0A455SWG6_9CHLR|nr:pitrilysin family protein [Thermosporothrix hazakensis]PZW26650.1 putative Zn-dependent peptidase [Thermosporothrix hazakensis]BBH89464.1 peptidase M16 [Thermosporothrix sp. COM3]GCE47648.1 peptidase M16 [Thermosporothrix hazakensis]
MSNQTLPPNYFFHRLPNGIELIGQYMPSLSSITLGFQLNAAVIHEPAEKYGLAHLFEYMLLQGTKQRDARALNEAFESLGARKGVSTSLEISQIWAQIVHNKFDDTLALLRDVLLTPTFPRNELEQMRNIILQEIRRRDDEPMSRIFELVRSKFYEGTSLGRPMLGTNESVRALQKQDLQEFWRERYQPDNVLFAIAGKFDWDHVVAQMETLFGDWSGQASAVAKQTPRPQNAIVLDRQEGKQEHICMLCPFPNYTDPDYYAAMILAEVLGGNMASRLFVEVREKRGLVYGVSASLAGNRHIGALRIYAGTTPEQGRECLQVIVNELRKLEQDGITADELERAKVQLKSENVMRSEGSGSRMGAIARSWWYERKVRTVHEVKDAIDAVTADQVMQVLQRYSPLNPLTVAAVGPLSRDELVGDTLPF